MRGIEQDQPPFYFSSESELELFIGKTVAVAVIQNITVDQSYRFKYPQRSGFEKDRCLIYHDLFDLSVAHMQYNHPEKTNWNVVWNVSLGVANRTEIYLTSDSVTFAGYNTPTAGWRLVLTWKVNHNHLCRPCKNMQSRARNISSSGTGTRLYINSLCVTAREGNQSTGIYFPSGNKENKAF